MKIALLTNEYPPYIYGGAGVHVKYLTRELAGLDGGKHSIKVFCFGDQAEERSNLQVEGVQIDPAFPLEGLQHRKLMDTLMRNLIMAGSLQDADVLHCHTWYTHFAGYLLGQLTGIPLVLTTHSLEPQRPWKEEQLGAAYRVSCWVERTAYENADGIVAVSAAMKDDVQRIYGVKPERVRVIYNGIDTDQYKPTPDPSVLASLGIDPNKPYILFVGRITRQKGIIHLVNAIKYLRPGIQVVLCAGAPDTKEIEREMKAKIEEVRGLTKNEVIWVEKMVPVEEIVTLYTHAAIFVCPSVYEPFGIINLEAMACGTPVVGSAVGGIPEVVVPGETGLLVPVDAVCETECEPRAPERFSKDLADAVNSLLADPRKIEAMSIKARRRVEEHFSWTSIARQTLMFYEDLVRSKEGSSAGA